MSWFDCDVVDGIVWEEDAMYDLMIADGDFGLDWRVGESSAGEFFVEFPFEYFVVLRIFLCLYCGLFGFQRLFFAMFGV